uniref:Uncharacterized protein n=1 Tax=Anguilla anguilla TaxID=7936 RepID=A0A0E9TFZ9_ANGAN
MRDDERPYPQAIYGGVHGNQKGQFDAFSSQIRLDREISKQFL